MESKSNLPSVLLLGSTGSGKSALCNTLIGDKGKSKFKESEKIDSCTQKSIVEKVTWFDGTSEFLLIDSPGMSDSEYKDTYHIKDMVKLLKDEIKTLNAFILVTNGQNPRVDGQMKLMFRDFLDMFGDGFFSHLIVVFTRWSFDERAVATRKENSDFEYNRSIDFNELIQKELKYNTEKHPIKCFFTCNSYNSDNIRKKCTKEELEKFEEQLLGIKKEVLSMKPFDCEDVKPILCHFDQMEEEIKELKELNMEHKKLRGGCMLCECNEYVYENEEFKKKSTCLVAATTGSGACISGIPGAMVGLGLSGVASTYLYMTVDPCVCNHSKKDHFKKTGKSKFGFFKKLLGY